MADDPELVAMGAVRDALEELDEDTRRRVLRWATERFRSFSPPPANRSGAIPAPEGFSDFASLFATANPGTEAEKALVAAYWFQVVHGEDPLDSQRLNTELKDLGHGIKNITAALDRLIGRRPRLIMQVRKGGRTKQARKSYRLTVEGVNRVTQMLAGPSEGYDDEE